MPGNRPRKLSSSSQAGGDSLLWSHLPLVEFSEKTLRMRNAGIRYHTMVLVIDYIFRARGAHA
jgi:hypothetical protein